MPFVIYEYNAHFFDVMHKGNGFFSRFQQGTIAKITLFVDNCPCYPVLMTDYCPSEVIGLAVEIVNGL